MSSAVAISSTWILFTLLFIVAILNLFHRPVHSAPPKSFLLDVNCVDPEVEKKCSKEARERFGQATDKASLCCVEKRVAECEYEHRRRHCRQYDVVHQLFVAHHASRMEKIEHKCGQFAKLCSGSLDAFWFTVFQCFVLIMVIAGLSLVLYVYFFG